MVGEAYETLHNINDREFGPWGFQNNMCLDSISTGDLTDFRNHQLCTLNKIKENMDVWNKRWTMK